MITLRYTFDDEQFDYDVDRYDIEKRLYEYLTEEWTKDDLVSHILDNDGCVLDYVEDFLEEIHNLFESEAEEHYYESKEDDYE